MTNTVNQPEPLDLDAIEARAAAATPGPWGANTPPGVVAANGRNVLGVFGGSAQDERDAEFTAHAREDVPALLAEVRRLRARVVELERPAVEARRDEIRQSYTDLIAAAEEAPDIAAADNPTPLRWGLGDVLWGDDDTVTVLLSGPGGEPYWLELDPERAAVLREDLAGPDGARDGAA